MTAMKGKQAGSALAQSIQASLQVILHRAAPRPATPTAGCCSHRLRLSCNSCCWCCLCHCLFLAWRIDKVDVQVDTNFIQDLAN